MATATGQAAAIVALRTAVSGAAIVSGAVVSTATTAATTNAADEPLAQATQLVADFADLQSWLGFRKKASKVELKKTDTKNYSSCTTFLLKQLIV